jgi:Methyltransferase domain
VYRFWSSVLRPLADAIDPRAIVEIGVDRGAQTRRVLRWAARRPVTLHAVDPAPRLDVAVWTRRYGEHLRLHLKPSLEALPDVGPVDLALIDGDHNWFTVFHELRRLEGSALEAGLTPPAIALHDVGWPYARRDMYYDASRLPPAFVHEHARRGMVPGRGALLEHGGINPHLANATTEGGARSGVLTAVEDFRDQAEGQWSLRLRPGFNGLGVLVPEQREADPRVRRTLERLWSATAMSRHARDVESARIALQLAAADHERRSGARGR